MTDSRFRVLERSAAIGDPSAVVRVLVERVRMGRLPRERLALAAWLGDPTAQSASGAPCPTPPDELTLWLKELAVVGGRQAVVRAMAAAGVHTFPARRRFWLGTPFGGSRKVMQEWAANPVTTDIFAEEMARFSARVWKSRRHPGRLLPLLLCSWAGHLGGAPEPRWRRLAATRLRRWARLAPEDPRPLIRRVLLGWALALS